MAEHKKWKIKLAIKAPNEKILSDKNLLNRVFKEADAWIDLGLHPNIAYCYYVRSLDEVLHVRVDYIEHQLAHTVRDPNGRAYNRTAHLDERKKMMQLWSDYLDGLKAEAKVLPFTKKAG